MANLHSAIISYKNRAMNEIINYPDLVKAIDPNNVNPEDLIYKNIFPYFRVPDTATDTKTFLSVCIDLPEAFHPENFMRDIVLKFCIIVHQSEMKTEYGATRLDYIADKLDDIFLGSHKYGYGKLYMLSSIESTLDEWHRCREIFYVSSEAQSRAC